MDLTNAISRYLASFGRKPDSDIIAAYALVLHELNDDQLNSGLNSAVRQDREHPLSAGQLRALCETGGIGREGLVERAWSALNFAIDRHGATKSVSFTDGLINAVVRQLGGWERVCSLPVGEFEKWFCKDFERTYLTLISNCPRELTAHLVGAIERENQRYQGKENPRTGQTYVLPPVEIVDVGYQPSIPALAAPKREIAEHPILELKGVPTADETEQKVDRPKPARMARKHDIPKSKKFDWCNQEDLAFELTEDQLQQQELNRRRLMELGKE